MAWLYPAEAAELLATFTPGHGAQLLCASEAKINKKIFYTNRRHFIDMVGRHFGPTIAVPTKNVAGDFSFLISRK